MTATLKEAIAAVRAGDLEKAQLLVADMIQTNPDDPQAWYLMSQLVDSPTRRAAYLNKTLELDPTHERALAEFRQMPPELTAQLAEVGVVAGELSPVPSVAEPEVPAPPEWLQSLGAEPVAPRPVATTSVPAQPIEQPALTSPPTGIPKKDSGRTDAWLIALWVVLGLVTLMVLTLLLYLLVR